MDSPRHMMLKDIGTPLIKYAPTKDGTGIAYCRIGSGPPLIYMPIGPSAHLTEEWTIQPIRDWYLTLAQYFSLVLYNQRGSGLSVDRNVSDLSPEAMESDVEALREAIGEDRIALWANFNTAPVAIRYAANHQGRVTRLLLWCPYADAEQYGGREATQQTRTLIHEHYSDYLKVVAVDRLRFELSEAVPMFVERVMLKAYTKDQLLAFFSAWENVHTSEFLPKIDCPALVITRTEECVRPGTAAELAKAIPDAQFKSLTGSSLLPYLGDQESVLQAALPFLGVTVDRSSRPKDNSPEDNNSSPHRPTSFRQRIRELFHPDTFLGQVVLRAAVLLLASAVVALLARLVGLLG